MKKEKESVVCFAFVVPRHVFQERWRPVEEWFHSACNCSEMTLSFYFQCRTFEKSDS